MEDKYKQIDYCQGCATTWVGILGLENCTYCNKPVKEIGWIEERNNG
jgi:hypothetical protein